MQDFLQSPLQFWKQPAIRREDLQYLYNQITSQQHLVKITNTLPRKGKSALYELRSFSSGLFINLEIQ